MKKFFTLKNMLICIAFAVLLLLVKDNIKAVLGAVGGFLGILTPFVIGFLIAYILNYPYKFFYTKAFGKMGKKRKWLLKLKKPLSVICTYAVVAAIIVFLVAILVPQIGENVATLAENFPGYIDTMVVNLDNGVDWINSIFHTDFNIDSLTQELLNKASKFFSVDNLSKIAGNTTNAIWKMLTGVYNGVYNFIMGVVISVYFLSAKDSLCRIVKKLAVAFIPIKYLPKIYEIVDITDTKCGRFLVGDIIDAVFVGVLTFVTMSIFRLPYAPLISVIVGITNIIPFFGPFIGAIPSAFILLLIDPWDMIKFIIIIVVIQQLDGNLFKPKIVGNQVGISSFWVLFSVLVGGGLFGLPGIILSTPIFAVIYSLVGKQARNKISDKGKVAQEALDFEVLNYTKIAEEQKRIRAEKENEQRDKIKKMIGLDKFTDSKDKTEEHTASAEKPEDKENIDGKKDKEDKADNEDKE